jgi:hypothetical protein
MGNIVDGCCCCCARNKENVLASSQESEANRHRSIKDLKDARLDIRFGDQKINAGNAKNYNRDLRNTTPVN